MMNKFLCYNRCSTCRKAQAWLEKNNIAFESRPIKEQNPTREELLLWIEQSGLPVKKFFNTSGILYREQNIKDKVNTLSKEELVDILASDGMLVKRPLFISNKTILLGFKEEEWENTLR